MDAQAGWIAPLQAISERQRKIAHRWATFGPYYAMFPVAFARQVIAENTVVGDGVLDPFSGRGTSVFCAGEMERFAFGTELNPVGWLYAKTKLCPAAADRVIERAEQISARGDSYSEKAANLPPFYRMCFAPRVLRFLVAGREELNWRSDTVDATLMAFVLTYLHGKIERGRPAALSNQMRQTKCMAPDYSIRWWLENGYDRPPDICPVEFLSERILWRYKHGVPALQECAVRFGDCRTILPRVRSEKRYRLLLTSPPYCGVTSYYYDQWLRLWMLGDAAHPIRAGETWKGKFEHRGEYEQLLSLAFGRSRRLLTDVSTISVRTDARELTLSITKRVLQATFPNKQAEFVPAPYEKATQTSLFGDKLPKPGEYDIILRPR